MRFPFSLTLNSSWLSEQTPDDPTYQEIWPVTAETSEIFLSHLLDSEILFTLTYWVNLPAS